MQFRNPISTGNYIRHIRSYAFLITMAVSIYGAFTFVPTPDASYATLRFGAYTGVYNAVWVSHVSATMLSVFLSLVGFFLVQGSIKKDADLGIGQLMGATVMSNTRYLFSKVCSNFLLLATIAVIAIGMSVVLTVLYSDDPTITLHTFILPYLMITIPSLFCVAVFSIFFEVLFFEQRIVQYILFFGLFLGTLLYTPEGQTNLLSTDMLGVHYITQMLEQQVQTQLPNADTLMNIGFIAAIEEPDAMISFSAIPFSLLFVGSRVLWMLLCCALLIGGSFIFHRFSLQSKYDENEVVVEEDTEESAQFGHSFLQHRAAQMGGLFSLIIIELKLLYKQNSYWQHLAVIAGFIFMFRSSLDIAHTYVLPLLWALQLTKWSGLVTREYTYNNHCFSSTAYLPIQRVFMAKVLAGLAVAIGLALPLLLRYGIAANFEAIINISIGGVAMVSCAVLLGTLTKSGKLFEVLFIVILYANLNQIAFVDYFGAMHATMQHTIMLLVMSVVMMALAIYRKTFDYE